MRRAVDRCLIQRYSSALKVPQFVSVSSADTRLALTAFARGHERAHLAGSSPFCTTIDDLGTSLIWPLAAEAADEREVLHHRSMTTSWRRLVRGVAFVAPSTGDVLTSFTFPRRFGNFAHLLLRSKACWWS